MFGKIKKFGLAVLIVSLIGLTTVIAATRADFSGYKGIAIGATADEVRKKLGEPKDKSDAMDLYVFSDSESAQFYYDPGHLVMGMMINYSGDLKNAPTPKDVFGEDVPPKADGGIFKMVRYPKAGFWVSYNHTAGSDAVITIAMQKI